MVSTGFRGAWLGPSSQPRCDRGSRAGGRGWAVRRGLCSTATLDLPPGGSGQHHPVARAVMEGIILL